MSYDNSPLLVERNERGFWVRAEQIDGNKSVLGISYTLAQSGEPVQITGTVAEQVFATVTVPGGLMGRNGALRVYAVYSMTGSVNAKTFRCKFGGPDLFGAQSVTVAATISLNKLRLLHNRNSESSQISFGSWSELTTGTAPLFYSEVNTAQDQVFQLTGQLANAGEQITLEAWTLEVLPG